MNWDHAVRLTEIMLSLAFLQQSAEHLATPGERHLFLPRLVLSLLLLAGFASRWVCLALFIHGLFILKRFNGPYNGGADRMGLLMLSCLCLAHFLPGLRGREAALGYLALQCVLSYFIAGWVKIGNPEWRSGRALRDVFLFSAYPVSEALRALAKRPRLLRLAAWAVMLFELLFPLSLLTPATLVVALVFAAIFHLANACLFGLNRFFWTWLAAYPSLLWLQERIS